MNRLLTLFVLLSVLPEISAEGVAADNYVRTLVPGTPMAASATSATVAADSRTRRSTVFYDGLGRQVLAVDFAAGGGGENIATMTERDRAGKDSCIWQAVPLSASGDAYVGPEAFRAAAQAFYGSERPYSLMEYEYNGLLRPVSATMPGEAVMAAHPSRTRYLTNTASGDRACRLLEVDPDADRLLSAGYYAPGSLQVTETTDGDGRVSLEFKDSDGLTVLSRRLTGEAGRPYADTYQVYDMFGNLRYVLSPEASAELADGGEVPRELVDRLGYRYRYDMRNRLYEKQLPGCGVQYTLYNELDQPVMTQDAEQRKRNEWTVMMYDSRLRPAVRGTAVVARSFSEMQTKVADPAATRCRFDASRTSASALMYAYPPGWSDFTPETAWYYDGYEFGHGREICQRGGYELHRDLSPAGLNTGSAQVHEGKIEYTMLYYDGEGREVARMIWDAGFSELWALLYKAYDFRGNVTDRLERFQYYGGEDGPEIYEVRWHYDYDRADRVTKVSFRDGELPWQTLAQYSYDAIGRLKSNAVPLTVSYGYNARGQMKSLVSKYISQWLAYEAPESDYTPSYTGNVARLREKDVFRTTTFGLGYDGLNRLRSFATATGSMAENVDYDLNTNPVAVRRSYQSNMTTDAVLSYDGNRLTGVSDVSSDAKMGTVPQIAAGDYADAIAYDAVGRPVRDDMRGITSISYHRACNRPKRIEFGSKGRLDFDYMPDGRLRAQTYSRAAVRSAVRVPGGLGPAAGDSVPAVRDSSRFEAAIVPVSERRFYGSYERVDGQMRVNTGFGHYSFADSVHRWYVKDWKGSVRHTAYQNKATGKMSFGQHTFVYPSGLPVITSNSGNIDRFHQDKRWIDAEGLDMYDNQARMYDPVYVRFTSRDELAEKFTHVSPWAYCAGNGIAYKDPSGMILEIAGTIANETRKEIFSGLETLSDDRLVLEKQRNGNYRVDIKEVRNGEHPVGTLLVGSLIKAKETTTIDSGNSLGAILNNKYANRNAFLSAKQSPTGTSIANIMPGLPAKAKIGYNESTGKYIREDSPLFVVISHELTHSHIDLTGNKMEGKVIYRGEEKSAFELQTLGLIGDYPINENKIREEHDVPKRIQY